MDELIARLVAEAEGEDDYVSFNHVSVVGVRLEAVADEIVRATLDRDFEMQCSLTRSRAARRRQKLYLSDFPEAHAHDGTVLWLTYTDTGLMERLSRLGQTHWISIDEDMRTHGYLRFQDGVMTDSILDPERLFTSTQISGADLRGEGSRDFEDYEELASRISGLYVPPDSTWVAGRWEDEEWREETLADGSSQLTWAVRLILSPGDLRVDMLGSAGRGRAEEIGRAMAKVGMELGISVDDRLP